MLKSCLVIVLFLFGIGTSYSQYLSFGDYLNLLDLAEDKAEAEKFLVMNGFKFDAMEYIIDDDDDEDDTTHYVILYSKKLIDDDYYVRFVIDTDEDIYTLWEYSNKEERSFYFVSILSEAELEPVREWDKGDGYEGFDFETKDYMITLDKKHSDDDPDIMWYRFFISKY